MYNLCIDEFNDSRDGINYCIECLRLMKLRDDRCFFCNFRIDLARSGDFPDEQASEAR